VIVDQGHLGGVQEFAISTAGLLATRDDHDVYVWDLEQRRLLSRFGAPRNGGLMRWDSGEQLVFRVSLERGSAVVDLDRVVDLEGRKVSDESVGAIAAAEVGTFRYQRPEQGAQVVRYPPELGTPSPAAPPVASRDGQRATATIKSWEGPTWIASWSLADDDTTAQVIALPESEHYQPQQRIAFGPDRASVVFFSDEGVDLAAYGGDAWRRTRLVEDPAVAVAMSPSGRVAAAAMGQALVVWELRASEWLERWRAPGRFGALAFSPEGRWLVAEHATGRWKGTVGTLEALSSSVFDAASGRQRALVDGVGVAFAPSARDAIFRPSGARGLLVYDAATWRFRGRVADVAPSPALRDVFPTQDRGLVVFSSTRPTGGSTADADRMSAWDVATGKVIASHALSKLVGYAVDRASGDVTTAEIDGFCLVTRVWRQMRRPDGAVPESCRAPSTGARQGPWPPAGDFEVTPLPQVTVIYDVDLHRGTALVGYQHDTNAYAAMTNPEATLWRDACWSRRGVLASSLPRPINCPEAVLYDLRSGVPMRGEASSRSARGTRRSATASEDVLYQVEGGLIRVVDRRTHRLRATLVEFLDGEHLAYTPRGMFVGPLEIADRIGLVFSSPAERYGLAQFADQLQRPDLVAQSLAGAPESAATVNVHRPPTTHSLDVVKGTTAQHAVVRSCVRSSAPLSVVRAFREGRQVAEKRVSGRSGRVDLDVPLLRGVNRIATIAYDERGFASNPAFSAIQGDAGSRAPALWVIAVGVSRYRHLPAEYQLEHADDDARALLGELRTWTGKGRDYARLHETLLLDDQVTEHAIRRALARLRRMHPDDLAIVMFAGHGVKLAPNAPSMFLTSEVAGLTPADVRAQAVGWSTISDDLGRARGRTILLLDACHGGHLVPDVVPNDRLAQELTRSGRSGVIVFAASKGRQSSYESSRSAQAVRSLDLVPEAAALVSSSPGNGYFTGAVLATLRDKSSDRDGDGAIQFSELAACVTDRVDRATGGLQTPWVARNEVLGDFHLVRRRSGGE
jgi:hypothetical protein